MINSYTIETLLKSPVWGMGLNVSSRGTLTACAHILILHTDRPLCRNWLAERLFWGAGVQ
jgi:hypothetical protein